MSKDLPSVQVGALNCQSRTLTSSAIVYPAITHPHKNHRFLLQVMARHWTDPDLRFWHYRDKDQVEVDLVITRGRQTWGVEVKSAVTATPADGQGLRRLADQCGADYQGGVLLYAGDSAFALAGGRNLAMPLARLWEM